MKDVVKQQEAGRVHLCTCRTKMLVNLNCVFFLKRNIKYVSLITANVMISGKFDEM